MKVLHKVFLFLCRVFTTLCKRRRNINIDIDNDGVTDVKIEISQDSNINKGEDQNEKQNLL